MNATKNHVFVSRELPNLSTLFNGFKYQAETILAEENYYTRIYFEDRKRPNTLLKLFNGKREPKPGDVIRTELYYACEGKFIEEENYWSYGSERIRDSILTFTEQKLNKQTEADVVYTFERLICKENSPWDWTNLSHKATIIKDYIPKHLKHRIPQIIRAFDVIYSGFLALNLKEAKERFCIIINGDSGTHKTKLSKMIIKKLADADLIVSDNSYVLWKQQDLSDKLPRTNGKEVVILDDYDGDNHKLGVYDALSGEDETKLRVMGDYETTRYIKGVIIPTVDALENWITSKTGTLRKFKQLCRRSDCNLYIFAPKHVQNPSGEDFRDRVFYVGDVRRGIYDTITALLPNIVDEPLRAYGKDTPLAQDLNKLFHRVCTSLYRDKKYWGQPYDRSQIPQQYGSYQPKTEQGAEKGVIGTFKLPSYEWLKKKVDALRNPDLKFPVGSKEVAAHVEEVKTRPEKEEFEKKTYAIDIETAPIVDSPLKPLEIKSIQLDSRFVIGHKAIQQQVSQKLVQKNLIAFNSPFEQTQLLHSQFPVGENNWIDVSLMARIYDNRLAEERIASLANTEEKLLGTTTKKDYIRRLVEKYGKKFFHHPEIEKDPIFQEYSINDTELNWKLYNYLKDKVSSRVFYSLQQLQDKLTKGAQRGIPFPRERLESALKTMRVLKEQEQLRQVDIRAGTKNKASLRGWSSSKLKTEYIKNYKAEWLQHLELTKSNQVKFDNEAKEKLFKLFPTDKVLQLAYAISKKERVIQHLSKLLQYADKDRLYPNYMMLGTSTGRFIATKPELHNLNRKPPANEKGVEKLYNVRDLLLGADNVFSIDFSSQEDRMSAYITRDPTDVADFIAGKDVHQELADRLGISRESSKRLRHMSRYGAGTKQISSALKVTNSEAQKLLDNYKIKYAQTFAFAENLREQEIYLSPLYGRTIRFSEFKDYTKFNGVVQGSCADLLLGALDYVLKLNKRVELRAHFHDSLYLACLCQGPHPGCKQSQEVVKEIEALFPFKGPNTNERVFKFGEIEWKGG